MKIGRCCISFVCFGAALLVSSLGAQPAFAQTNIQVLASEGESICDTASIAQAGQQACYAGNYQLADFGTQYPTLYGLSQQIAATLDVGYKNVHWADRQTYTSDVYYALLGYTLLYQPSPNPCPSGSAGWPDPPVDSFCAGLDAAWGAPQGTGAYYDDNAWVGMDLLDAYRWSCQDPSTLTGSCNAVLLDAAEGIFSFEQTGLWTSDDNGIPSIGCSSNPNEGECSDGALNSVYQGGLFFQYKDHKNRPVVVNAAAALFASELGEDDNNFSHTGLTHPFPWGFANYEYQWVQGVLTNNDISDPFWALLKPDGCVTNDDVVDPEGCTQYSMDPSRSTDFTPAQSYATGLMIGTATNLSNFNYTATAPRPITPAGFLSQAEGYADNTYFSTTNPPPSNSDYSDLLAECPAYDAVYLHYLWELDNISGGSYNSLEPAYVHWVQNPHSPGSYAGGFWIPPWKFIGQPNTCADPIPNSSLYLVAQAGGARAVVDDAAPNSQTW